MVLVPISFKRRPFWLGALVLALLPAPLLVLPLSAAAEIEEILVTAQKRAENAQDVPISIAAFDEAALTARQIETFADLQLSVPNVSFAKGNFANSNFQVRGIGTLLSATSADTGVGLHVNDIYLNAPRIFETEYYDMEQLEVLRGPQGTLFGRNATGGAVNVRTARPELGTRFGSLEGQLGNFDHRRLKGMVNLPLGEHLAARFAGIWIDRDGYSRNELARSAVDGRDQWSVRASLRFEPSDRTRIDLIGYHFEEDSDRTRSQKQLCDRDPSGVLGCLPTGLGTEAVNGNATLPNLLSSTLLLGPLGVNDFFASDLDATRNPRSLRAVRQNVEPEYASDETFLMLEWQQAIGDQYQLTLLAAQQDSAVLSVQDFNGTATQNASAVVPAAFCGFAPAACDLFGLSPGSALPVSTLPDPRRSLGALAGDGAFALDDRGAAADRSAFRAEQQSVELRLASESAGPVNFLIAGYYLNFRADENYFLTAAGIDYSAIALGNGALAGNPTQFVSLAPAFFNNDADRYELESLGLFGEIYYDLTDSLKVTLGLRYTKDDKTVRDAQAFFNAPVLVDVPNDSAALLGSDGSVTPVQTINELLAAAVTTGDYDADPNRAGAQRFRQADARFDAITGRLVVDWLPDWSATDESLVYFSYARGYKAGGVNPPIDSALFPNTPQRFDREAVDAFELGAKNTFWDRRAQLNGSLFYYRYGDLQIGKVVNRTVVNENTDADLFGAELELQLVPTDRWAFNAAIAYLNTSVADTESVDPRDPTQGRTDVTLLKDFTDGSNCVIEHNGQPAVSDNGALVAALQGLGAPYLPTGRDLAAFGGPPGAIIPETPGVSDSAFTACAAAAAIAPLFGYGFSDSIATNLSGNELIQAPELSINLGAEYRHFFGNGMLLTARLDYYWQDAFYSTVFNRPQDRIGAWDLWNAQLGLESSRGWFARLFVQNLEDDDEIVGTYQADPATGLFTNVFLNEPRLYGLTVGLALE